MYAQVTYFDGPRSPELVAASARAGRERIKPAILGDVQMQDELMAVHVLRQPDGGEIVVVITTSEAGLQRARQVILGTELLPGEDAALLPGPDRVEFYEVVDSHIAMTAGAPA